MNVHRAARGTGVAAGVAVLVWSALAVQAERSGEASMPPGGIQRANQLVVKDTGGKAAQKADAADSSVSNSGVAKGGLFADMALLSSKTVTYSSLGLIVRNPEGKRVSVAVHDSKGRPVIIQRYKSGVPFVNVGTSGLSAGVYVYTVRVGEKLHTAPFIVSR